MNGEIDFFEPLGGGFTLLAQPSFGYAAYRAVDPAFNTTRHDKTYAVAANLGFEPAFLHCQLALGITFTANHSNQSLYSYNRVQTTLQLKVPFQRAALEGVGFNIAVTLAVLEETDRALDIVEKHLPYLPRELLLMGMHLTNLDQLRDNPRFKAILAKVQARLAEATSSPEV